MSINTNLKTYTAKPKIYFNAYGDYGAYGQEQGRNRNNRWGISSAAAFTLGGAAAGALHAKFFNCRRGKLPDIAENPTIEVLQNKVNETVNAPQRRTAQKALRLLKKAEEKVKDRTGETLKKAEKEAAKLKEKAVNYLKKGTKAYSKAAVIGGAVGAGIFAAHKYIFAGKNMDYVASQDL